MSDKLKLEAGKYYRTRDGRKAFVAAIELPNPFGESIPYSASGYINGGTWRFWRKDGMATDADYVQGIDLVAEWQEPRSLQVHLALCELADGSMDWQARTGEPPHVLATTKIIARKTVTITEGEGVS